MDETEKLIKAAPKIDLSEEELERAIKIVSQIPQKHVNIRPPPENIGDLLKGDHKIKLDFSKVKNEYGLGFTNNIFNFSNILGLRDYEIFFDENISTNFSILEEGVFSFKVQLLIYYDPLEYYRKKTLEIIISNLEKILEDNTLQDTIQRPLGYFLLDLQEGFVKELIKINIDSSPNFFTSISGFNETTQEIKINPKNKGKAYLSFYIPFLVIEKIKFNNFNFSGKIYDKNKTFIRTTYKDSCIDISIEGLLYFDLPFAQYYGTISFNNVLKINIGEKVDKNFYKIINEDKNEYDEIKTLVNAKKLSINNSEEVFINKLNCENIIVKKILSLGVNDSRLNEVSAIEVVYFEIDKTEIYHTSINGKIYSLVVYIEGKLKQSNNIPLRFYKQKKIKQILDERVIGKINKISALGVEQIDIIPFSSEGKRIIYLDEFIIDFTTPFYINIINFSESNILFLPKKENSLKIFLPYLKNISIYDMYDVKKEEELEALTKNGQILEGLSYVENELRVNKHIKLANFYAALCDDKEFGKSTFVDKVWGSKKLYKFGYAESPLWIFFKLQGIILIILMSCYMLINFKIQYWYPFSEDKFWYYIFEGLIPFFKMNPDTTPILLKIIIVLSNLCTAINFLGLGVTLKRRFSRTST